MTRDEAEAFVVEALALAMSTDSSSGGCVRLVAVDATGAHERFIPGDQVPLFQDDQRPGVNGGAAGMVLG